MSARIVEVLVFDGCPNVAPTLERVQAAIAAARKEGITLRILRVKTDEQAREVHFLGSPSVRVDGLDVETSARSRAYFGLQCRVYDVGGRLEGAPPVEWIRAALSGAACTSVPTSAAIPARGCCAADRGSRG